MKLSLPGVPIGAGARPNDLGEFAPLLEAEVVAQTEVLGTEHRRIDVRPVQTEMAPADVLELSWEGGIIELVPAAKLEERFVSQRGAEIVTIPMCDRPPGVAAVRGSKEFALQAVKQVRLAPRRLIQAGVLALVREIEERAIPEPGVHRLEADGRLGEQVDETLASNELPYLVLLHGAFENTRFSFEDLFSSPEWSSLRDGYAGRMLALEQRALTDSPAKNALDLVRALPRGAALHLLSYSRGGLIGELLCREPWQKNDPALDAFFSDARHATQREELTELAALLVEKSIRVERFARVACPAAGTLLASERLERYLNVLLSLIGHLSGMASPAFSFVKAIALAIAGSPAEADLFPGLEAVRPQLDQGFVPFLNASSARPGRELAVIAGDAQGGGIFERVKAFFSDLYFREDNDFVIDSKSMFRGVPRQEGRALYRRSPETNHFSYFSMRETRECAVDWLLHGQSDKLSPLNAARDYGGLRALASRAIPKLPGPPKQDGRPVVFLVPGIMGTHLARGNDRIWVAILKLAWGGLTELAYRVDDDVTRCDGLIESYYERLFHFLSRSHRVEAFAYDWRRPMANSADALAGHVKRELDQHGRPVRFIAHSMGGLVCRALIARHRELWEKMVSRGGRLVMLGTPNHGSFVPAQVLTRKHSLMDWLARVDTKNDLEALTEIVGAFPGLLEMLPWKETVDLMTAGAWKGLAQFRPEDGALARALEFRRELAEKGVDPKHMVYVAGHAAATPDRVEFAAGEVRFGYTRRGDGTVPWDLGRMLDVDTYFVDAAHGQIQNHERSFEGFADLLADGHTRKLDRSEPLSTRALSADALVAKAPPELELRYYPRPEDLLAHVLGTPNEGDSAVVAPLTLSVVHGDVREIQAAILVGHYRGDKLVSVEKLLDRQLKGALNVRHRLEMYPGDVGTCHIEQNVIVVGLGQVGQLTRAQLEQTVARGLVEYALRAAQREPESSELSLPVGSLLIGTYGGTRLTVEASIEAIAGGALRANEVLRAADGARSIRISQLTFVELYEDIATEAMHSAIDVAGRSRGALVVERRLRPVSGALRSRPRSPYASGWSQRIEIRLKKQGLCYHVATDLARSEPFTRPVQWSHVEPLLAEAARTDNQARAVLFRYLLPRQLVSAATRAADLVLDLDRRSATVPWELLGPAEPGVEPLGVRVGVLRQLSTRVRREEPVRSRVRRALVIGNPKNVEPSLPGAREEAKHVVELFRENGIDVLPCIEKSADETFRDLWTGEYDFIHIAAHGEYDEKEPQNFGVVLEGNRRLTSAEFDSPTVPTLVFLNCCHLGALTREGAPRHPGQLAASVAEHLIQMGVKVVVAAGWAVSDRAAVTFATTLYAQLLSGRTLMDAVRAARKQTYDVCGSNDVTWGAYQVYGHDGFILPGVPEPVSTPQRAAAFVSAQEFIDFIADYPSRARSAPAAELKQELAELVLSFTPDLRERGDIAHAIGMAYGTLKAYSEAIQWLTRAAQSSLAPFETAEQLANYEARHAAQLPLEEARPLFVRSITRLEQLIELGASQERHSLLGASHKRFACQLAGDERKKHVKLGRAQYRKAVEKADRAKNWWYPALNDAVLALADDEGEPTDAELDQIEEGVAVHTPVDTWTRLAKPDIALVRYCLGRGGSADAVARLYREAFDLGAGALPSERDSVRDHVSSILQLALDGAVQSRLKDVSAALFDSPPPTSEVTSTASTPRAAE